MSFIDNSQNDKDPDLPGLDEIVSQLRFGNVIMSQLLTAVRNLRATVTGTFTLGAAASTTVTDTAVAAASIIYWEPTNAAAGTLEGSTKKLYESARVPGTSFTVSTASGVAAAGSETFRYMIWTPL